MNERMGQVSWLHLIAFATESLIITLPIKMMATYMSSTVVNPFIPTKMPRGKNYQYLSTDEKIEAQSS